MEKKTMEQFIEEFMKSEVRRQLIPMELRCGWPAITIRNKEICVILSFFRSSPNGKGQMNLYPLCQSAVLKWKDGKMVSFRNHLYEKEFAGVDFLKPVGVFRHEAIADWDKKQYMESRKRLFSLYDRLIGAIQEKEDFPEKDEMAELLGAMMEPSLLPMYRKVAAKFFTSYCRETK